MSEERERMSLAGTHRAKAIEYEFGYANNGTAQVALMFKISEGQDVYSGKTLAWFGSFHPNALNITLDALRRCGWDTDDISQLDGVLSNEVEIVCEDETYQDRATGQQKTTTKVRWVNKPLKLNVKNKMDAIQLAAFAAQMRGEAVASRSRVAMPATPAAARSSAFGSGAGYQQRTQSRPQQHNVDRGAGADAPYNDDDNQF